MQPFLYSQVLLIMAVREEDDTGFINGRICWPQAKPMSQISIVRFHECFDILHPRRRYRGVIEPLH